MKKILKITAALIMLCIFVTMSTFTTGALEYYREAEMFENEIPKVSSVPKNYDIKIVDRGDGNKALQLTALEGSSSAFTVPVSLSDDFEDAHYLEFYMSVKSNTSKSFQISPSIHDATGWHGFNSATGVIYNKRRAGEYYIKEDDGDWQLKQSGANLWLSKDFSGYIRLPIECFSRNTINSDSDFPIDTRTMDSITTYYSNFEFGDVIIFDDFRFVQSDDSFIEHIEVEDTSDKLNEQFLVGDGNVDLDSLFDVFPESNTPVENVASKDSASDVSSEKSDKSDASANNSDTNGTTVIIVVISVAVAALIAGALLIVIRKAKLLKKLI